MRVENVSRQLSEQQKQKNREEAQNTLFQIALEYIMKNGDIKNATNN